MKLNLRSRLSFLIEILTGKSELFNHAALLSKVKLFCLSLIRIPFSTYSPIIKLRAGDVVFECMTSYEIALYQEIFLDRTYSSHNSFSPAAIGNDYVAIDIGANIGLYSVYLSMNNPAGRIYAFEPNGSIIARLKRNLSLNKVKNVEIIEAALWSKNSELAFSAEKYSVLSRVAEGNVPGEGKVPGMTLDAFVSKQGIGRIDLIKIDAEFAEDEILLGAREIALGRTIRIVLEYHSEEKKAVVEKVLAQHGFNKLKEQPPVMYFAKPDAARL